MPSDELMYINWQDMIKPGKVQVSSKPNYGKFVCEPLERGFGITVGNSLRRIILSSLYGAAVTAVKFDGVMHEFSVIPGVLEDVSEVILNLREVRLRVSDTEPKTIRIDAKGEGKVTAGDIISDDGKTEVLNPGLHIATLADKAIDAAVSDVLNTLIRKLEEREWRTSILTVEDGNVYISGGKHQGIKPGNEFAVIAPGKTIRSEQTGMNIELPGEQIAVLEVVSTFGETEAAEGSITKVTDGALPETDTAKLYVAEKED